VNVHRIDLARMGAERADDARPAARLSDFDVFFAAQRAESVRLAHLLTGSMAIAQEVAQEAFIAIHRRWAELDNPAAYLRVTVVNAARSTQRRQALERRHLRSQPEPVTAQPDLDATWHLLRRLPLGQRTAIVLRFYEDMSISEIGEAMGKPTGTVKSLIHRGLARLRETMP
jgi:RNA polymerase sigma-70 factor (sigma-E family)